MQVSEQLISQHFTHNLVIGAMSFILLEFKIFSMGDLRGGAERTSRKSIKRSGRKNRLLITSRSDGFFSLNINYLIFIKCHRFF